MTTEFKVSSFINVFKKIRKLLIWVRDVVAALELLVQFWVEKSVKLVLHKELRVKSFSQVSSEEETQASEQKEQEHNYQGTKFGVLGHLISHLLFSSLRISNVVRQHPWVPLQKVSNVTPSV